MRTLSKIYINIHIYKYIFRSNSRGLAPLGPARPDKFINLASRGKSIYRRMKIFSFNTFSTDMKLQVIELQFIGQFIHFSYYRYM